MQCGALHTLVINSTVLFSDIFICMINIVFVQKKSMFMHYKYGKWMFENALNLKLNCLT